MDEFSVHHQLVELQNFRTKNGKSQSSTILLVNLYVKQNEKNDRIHDIMKMFSWIMKIDNSKKLFLLILEFVFKIHIYITDNIDGHLLIVIHLLSLWQKHVILYMEKIDSHKI